MIWEEEAMYSAGGIDTGNHKQGKPQCNLDGQVFDRKYLFISDCIIPNTG